MGIQEFEKLHAAANRYNRAAISAIALGDTNQKKLQSIARPVVLAWWRAG